MYKHLPDQKKPFVKDELGKLVAEWPTEVIKRQKKDDRKAMEEALVTDIPKMISSMASTFLWIWTSLPLSLKQHREENPTAHCTLIYLRRTYFDWAGCRRHCV
ncbi:hypothetical protein ACQ4PT_057490 [Festuca glaucescens]